MTNEEKALIKTIKHNPYKVAQAVGFRDVRKNPHNAWMQEIIWGKDDITLMAHRGSYKSSILSVCIALIMVFFPYSNILFFRKTDTDVHEMIKMVAKALRSKIIVDISIVIYGEPVVIVKEKADVITTNLYASNSGAEQLLGLGINASITGKHADFVFTDDICNIKDRQSRAERDKTKLQFQELINIRNRGGRIISLGTKWHKDDVFTLMNNIQRYTYKETGLITEKELAELKERLSPALFACNYELKIISDDEIIFTEPQTGADDKFVLNGYSHCDAAFYGEDYTAFSIMSYHDGFYYVLGKCWRKSVDDVAEKIADLHSRYLCTKMYMELNADKGYAAKQFRNYGLKVSTYHESMNKYIKIVTYLKNVWKNVIFVEGTDDDYIDMICDYNENAEHDDPPDSLASLIRSVGNKTNRNESEEYTLFL